MASRAFSQVNCIGIERVLIAGSFAPDTANEPTDLKGKGFTVAHTATGIFTVTLQDKYVDIESVTATLQLETADDQFVNVGDIDVDASTIILEVWDVSAGALADVAADEQNRVNFMVVCKNTSITNS